jgi:acyl-CoA synthetase (AMP-forming)/AMP-acid ligase II
VSPSSIGAFVTELRAQLTEPGSAFEVVEETVRGHRMVVFRHRARNARELFDGVHRFDGRPYLVDGDLILSFDDLRSKVDGYAVHLQRELGVASGDRVAIHAANRWEWVIAYWAAITIGALPALFNGYWTADETAHAIQLIDPVTIVADKPRLEVIGRTEINVTVASMDDIESTVRRLAGQRPILPPLDEDQVAELVFTSGTTGRARAVAVPHRSLVGFVQLNQFNDALARVANGGAVPRVGEAPPVDEDVVLVTSPLFHVSMLHGVVLQAITSGSSFVLLPGRFDPDRVLATIEHKHVTRWLALGSAGPRVAGSPSAVRYDTSSLRLLGLGGAPVSPSTQQALRDAFPSAKDAIGMGYTSTEAGAVVAGIGGPEYQLHPTATGRTTITTTIELLDTSGRVVAEGELGEVHVRSPYLMLGYWNDPSATAAALTSDGWLAMGDVAHFEADLLHIDSRARDMILVSAENVSPAEVEYRLEAHPAVREASVLAVDHPLTGDAVGACIVAAPQPPVSFAELATWCAEELAEYKIPTRWIKLDRPLPRTASGKVLKHEIRDLFVNDLEAEPK